MRKNWTNKEVKITWLDIIVDVNTQDNIEPYTCTTFGYVEFQNDIYIRVLTSKYERLDIADKIAIPIGCICKIEEIKCK